MAMTIISGIVCAFLVWLVIWVYGAAQDRRREQWRDAMNESAMLRRTDREARQRKEKGSK